MAGKAALKVGKGQAKLARQAISSREPRGGRLLKYGFFALLGLAIGAAIARSRSGDTQGGSSSFTGTTGHHSPDAGSPAGQRGETWGSGTPTGTAGGTASGGASDPAAPQSPDDPNRTGAERGFSEPSSGPLIGEQHRSRIETPFKNLIAEMYPKDLDRLFATLPLVFVVLLAAWMGGASEGGYFEVDWAPSAFALAALFLVASVTGWLWGARSPWSTLAITAFAAYTAWTFAALLWSPNQGDAWRGAGQTLLYLLAFWVAVGLIASGASRRWVLLASALGPTTVALFTLLSLTSRLQYLFENNRLFGTVQYHNGTAAFLLIPFWAAVYLAGSPRVNPILRGVVLAGAVLCVAVAVLAQSRGAMVAMAVSLPVFFVLSGQRLRGFLALVPLVAALLVTFPNLNGVYLAFLNEDDPAAALDRAISIVWLCAAGAGFYGLSWGLLDRWWRPPLVVARIAGGVVLAACVAVLVFGAFAFTDRVGDPVTWSEKKWEEFKTGGAGGMERSRYLSASGWGRYDLWKVAWEDFEAHPILGVGPYNYEATYYQLRPDRGHVRQPHSLPLEVLAERGGVGGVLFFGFLATCLTAATWQRFRRLNDEGKGLVGAAVAAVTYWFVHSSAEWFWQLPAVTLPAMVYLAVLVAPWKRETSATASVTRWPLRAAGAGLALAMIAAITPLYVADLYLQESEASEENPWVALLAVERAQKVNPVNPWLAQREAELAWQIGDWPRVEHSYRNAIRLNPEHYAPYYLLAVFSERRGKLEQALSLYRRASYLNPLDQDIKERLKRAETRMGEDGPAAPSGGGNTE
jgi:tetratricopeptide (TPR) repeat protein